MSTAAFSGAPGPALMNREPRRMPVLSTGIAPTIAPDLTIYRITETHHGRTLLTLGHAAEYLADTRRFFFPDTASRAEDEAIHILMRLARNVFDEYVERVSGKKRREELVTGCVTGFFNRKRVQPD